MSDTVVVTGAAGFIGSHLVRALLDRGCRVVGIDNFDPFYDASLKRAALKRSTIGATQATGADQIDGVSRAIEEIGKNAASRPPAGTFELHEIDICDRDAVTAVMQAVQPTGAIHLAAKAGVTPSLRDPAGYSRTNVLGTSVVLDAAHAAGCSRVVVASSSSVYGDAAEVPFAETADVNEPISPYAATKRACELLSWTHHHTTGQPVSCLRFFTVFGPGQRPDLAISTFLGKLGRGDKLAVFGDGTSSRDYTYVGDIVAGVLAAWERTPDFGYRIWNLGSDRPTTLDELVHTAARVVGVEPQIERLPPRTGDVQRTWADLMRSAAELGYSAQTSLEAGIRLQWEAMRSDAVRAGDAIVAADG
ncbi:MAG: NAD-dependent epimerase/dehydratase family protein [Planctomycetota bacterium]